MKILIHAINGIGIGHLTRTLEIAKSLVRSRKDVEIVFITNSQCPNIIKEEGFRYHQLKFNTKSVLDKKISYEEYLNSNEKEIKSIINKELPDVVLFDSEFNASIIRYCKNNIIKTVFVLRKTSKENFEQITKSEEFDALDLILIPHNKKDLPTEDKKELDKHPNVVFTNPIIKDLPFSKGKKREDILNILITFSSGANIDINKEIFEKTSDFLKKIKDNDMKIGGYKAKLKIITGPYFETSSCDLQGFGYKNFEKDMIESIDESDLIISPAGYNIINEITYTKTPAFIFPVKAKHDEQFERANNLEKKGCAKIIEDDIFEEIKNNINKLENMKKNFPEIERGKETAAKEINRLLGFKKKVGILRSNWLPNSERFIHDEVKNLNFYLPHVFCIHKEDNFKDEIKTFYSNKFENLWNPNFPFIKKRDKNLYELYIRWCERIIKLKGIEILHAEFMTDALFYLKLKKLTSLPLIVSVRGHDLYNSQNIDYSKLFREADIFLVRSKKMKKDLVEKGCPAKKIRIHHSGIPLKQSETRNNNTKTKSYTDILMVGRLVEKKGILFGIDIFNEICKKYNNIRLNIIGSGPLKDKTKEKIEESPFSPRIHLLGEISNEEVIKNMEKSEILIQPSLTSDDGDKEGIPNSIMEAMSQNLLVVASDNGSITEIVEDNKTGFLFKEKNLQEAVEKTKYTIDNISNLKNIKEKARRKFEEEFNIEKNTSYLESIYSSFLEDKSKDKYFERYYENYNKIRYHDTPGVFRVDIHPIKGCNSHCIMCDNWKNKVEQFVSVDRIKEILKEIKEYNVEEVRFHGQEPTLLRDLPELINYSKKLGFMVSLKTNGNLSIEDYEEVKLDKLYLSIDSPQREIHNKLRGNPNSYDNNLKVIEHFNKDKNIKIKSNSVVTKYNYKTLIDMPDFAFKKGISDIGFVLLNNKNKKDVDGLFLNKEELHEFFFEIAPEIVRRSCELGIGYDFSPFFADLVLKPSEKSFYELKYNQDKYEEEINNFSRMEYGKKFYEKYGCYGPLDHCSINYDGSVYPCCVVERTKENSMGNINDESFKNLWNNRYYKDVRRKTLRTNGGFCEYYKVCGSNFDSRKYLAKRIHEKEKEDEKEALKHLKNINKDQFKNREEIEKIKNKKKKEVASFVSDKIPFYKNKGSDENIENFEILEKTEIRDNIYKGMINKDYIEHPGLVLDRTSGTIDTTVPFAYLRSYKRYVRMVTSFLINSKWKWKEPFFVFTTLHCSRERCSNDDLPHYVNREKLKTSDNIFSDEKILAECSKRLESHPRLVHADPIYLSALAKYINSKNKNIKLRGISSTYELLFPTIKRYLKRTFQCKVFDDYGCSEFGPIAFSCEEGNKHIFFEDVFVEVINKGKYKDKEVGEIVITSLDNKAMPLIRYRTGDVGKKLSSNCPCGRKSEILEVYGTKTDCININNILYTERDIAELLNLEGILFYQIKKNKEGIDIDIIPSEEKDYEEISKKVKRTFKSIGLPKININFVQSILPEESGKFKSTK